MSAERNGHETEPSAHITNLVNRVFTSNPTKVRHASRELLNAVSNDPYLDSALFAVLAIQNEILFPKTTRKPSKIPVGVALMEEISGIKMRGTGQSTEIKVRVNNQMIKAVDSIVENDQKIKINAEIRTNSAPEYRSFARMAQLLQDSLRDEKKKGASAVTIVISKHRTPPGLNEEASERALRDNKVHYEWVKRVDRVLDAQPNNKDYFKISDRVIELLKIEPENSVFPRDKMYIRKYGEIALADIGKMPYPLSEENCLKVLTLLEQVFSDKMLDYATRIASQIFFSPTMFTTDGTNQEDANYINRDLLANINSWQEWLTDLVVFNEDKDMDQRIKAFLLAIPKKIMLAQVMFSSSYNYLAMNPTDKSFTDKIPRHPIGYKAIMDYQARHEADDLHHVYADEIGLQYFANTIIPKFKARLAQLGIADEFLQMIRFQESLVAECSFATMHLDAMRNIFETNSGIEFLDKLKRHYNEILEVKQKVWEEAINQMHFLPMRGINSIQFSEDSIPGILGLESIDIIRTGSEKDWGINVKYNLRGKKYITLMGNLQQDGNLRFRADLEKEMPTLYLLLNHIAVVVFKDLVTQEDKKSNGSKNAVEPVEITRIREEKGKSVTDNSPGRRSSGSLPRRVQHDRDLIRKTWREGSIWPRTVELHTTRLKYSYPYEEAVNSYKKLVERGALEEEIAKAKKQLEIARAQANSISEGKKANLPKSFKLETITDPVTNQERTLETWVVEHTSPKPTDEELASPLELYTRYYSGSSALASLDQMIPWLIGQ